MKKRIISYLPLLLVFGLAISCKPERNELELSKFLIDSIQSQTIADGRVEVFSILATYAEGGILLKGKTTHPEAITKLTDQLKVQQVQFLDSIIRLPDPALGDKSWGLVTISVANIRYTPAHSAEMATQAIMGTPVRILQEDKGWYLIQTPDHYIAWTESAGIAPMTQLQLDKWKSSDRLIFLSDFGTILNKPDESGLPVSDIVMGSILTSEIDIMGRGSFVAVELPDGRKGFLNRSDCRSFNLWCEQTTPDSIALINTAVKLMGRPYLWGGTSIKGMDCSGFTKTIYMTGGLILSRDASQQVLQGDEAPGKLFWQELKAGDLLFFGRKATAELSEKVSHVGMYIGESTFIHCSGMVKENSLDSTQTNFKPYYHTNLLRVKRIIGSKETPVTYKSHTWYN